MVYMFNELSLKEVNSISDARTILDQFVKSIIFGGELGLTEMRLYELIQICRYALGKFLQPIP
jgi:hypothetical protein